MAARLRLQHGKIPAAKAEGKQRLSPYMDSSRYQSHGNHHRALAQFRDGAESISGHAAQAPVQVEPASQSKESDPGHERNTDYGLDGDRQKRSHKGGTEKVLRFEMGDKYRTQSLFGRRGAIGEQDHGLTA
jgi:hypothetical protein